MVAKVLHLTLLLGVVAVTSVIGQRNIALSGPEFRRLRLGQNPEFLQYAAMTLETVTIVIDGPEVLAVVQEDVNANFWCLPWLQRFPGGSIRWFFQRREVDTGDPVPGSTISEISGNDPLIRIGGDFNEWLNITGTILVLGAASTSNGLYVCEVCLFRGTQFEECHMANTSLQVIGGPPFLDVATDNNPVSVTGTGRGAEIEYLIGSDFCIAPGYRGTITILCVIINAGQPNPLNISRAFPVPFRSWSLNGDLLYSELSTSIPDIRDSTKFFSASVDRMVLMPQYFFLESVLGTPTVGRLQGGIQLNFALDNATFAPLFDSLEAARAAAYRVVVGAWTCGANNTFGSDMATSNVRICSAPDVQVCPSENTQFPQSGDVVPVGCTVCIPEGDVIVLNCTGQSVSEVFYKWQNGAGIVVSTSPLLTTDNKDNYTCTATNLDHIPAIFVSMVAYREDVTFTAQYREEFFFASRVDNGCSRLTNQVGLENVTLCAFVGETIELNCATDDNEMVPLEITAPDGSMANGSLIVSSVDMSDEGTYSCRLSKDPGPCGQATEQREVRVFVPRCPLGTYIADLSTGESACVPCPGNSFNSGKNLNIIMKCTCFRGYYRTKLEGPNFLCSAPPVNCKSLQVVAERTQGNTITVRWERPEITGRDDFYYNIFYSEDNQTFTQHNSRPYVKQDALVDYSVSGLRPLTTYTIRVITENGVSDQEEGRQNRSCEVVTMTGDTRSNAPSLVIGFCTNVVWTTPTRSYGRITGYDVRFAPPQGSGSDLVVSKGRRELFHAVEDTRLVSTDNIMVQVRAKTSAAEGRWSELVPLGCRNTED